MKRAMIKKLLATVMVSMFVINGITITKVDAVSNTNEIVESTAYKLNPTPRSVEVNEGNVTITSSINVKGLDVADEDAIRVLNEFLNENNIKINETYNENSTTLIIGEVNDEISDMDIEKNRLGVEDTDILKNEGYVFASDSDNSGTILIEGKDEDGTFYGVKTLTQLAVNNEGNIYIPEVVITDEPTMTTRGIVEGFFGNPWSHEDRLSQLEFYGDYKMNTYIYDPKDDPYHRAKWRDPYPEAEMENLKELIETANENKVDFVFSIAPGIDINLDGPEAEADYKILMEKCESVYEMGARSFAIFWDDIDNVQADKQAELLNRFNREFVKAKGDVNPLITVPKEYDTGEMVSNGQARPYTRVFANTLDKDIEVMWTGRGVVPEGITIKDAQLVNGIYGKQLGVWWNYPVTDYMPEKLALGPVHGLVNNLDTEIDFFTMNPMEHAELAKISLVTGADYSWNTSEYDYDKSWNIAIEKLFGDLAPEMKTFANHSTRMDMRWAVGGRADAPEVRAEMNSLWNKLSLEEDASAEFEALYKEFDNMVNAADKLNANLPADILEECKDNLDKLKVLGQYDKMALDMIKAIEDGNKGLYDSLRVELEAKLPELKLGSKVSEKVELEFINEALNYDIYMVNPLSIKVTASSEETAAQNNPASNVSDNNTNTMWHSEWSGNSLETGNHWITLELNKEQSINKVRYVPRVDSNGNGNGTLTKYKVLTSIDGKNFEEVASGNLKSDKIAKFIEFEEVNAKYVKLEFIESVGGFASASEFNVYKSEKSVEESVLSEVVASIDKESLTVGEEANISLSGKMSNGEVADLTNATVEYSSSNQEVAKVENGIVTALKSGTADIVANVTVNDTEVASNKITITILENEVISNGKTTITTPEIIKVDDSFAVNLGVSNLKPSIEAYAAEYIFTYNPEVFDYVGVEAAKDGVYAVGIKNSEGEIRVIVSSLGEAIVSDSDLVKVNLVAKKEADKELLAVTASNLGDGDGNIQELELANKVVNVEANKPADIIVGKVSGLVAESITNNSVELSWNASTSTVGLIEYVIYKDGKAIDTISADSTKYKVDNLRINTIYGFKVTAKYSNGKESKPVSINVRTKKASTTNPLFK